jgi:cell shape-determining protein MreC
VRATISATSGLIILAVILIMARLFFGLTPVEQFLQKTISPIAGVVERLQFSGASQVSADENFQAQIENLETKNSQLRDQLGLKDSVVLAEVLSRDITGFRKSFIINKGSDSGVKTGQAVTQDNFLVGLIDRVTPTTATVMAITDPQFKATATTKSGAGGVVRNDSGSLKFDLVPVDDAQGQLVVADGVDGKIKPGISVGVLGQRITSDDETFHGYNLILPFQLSQVDLVKVEVGGAQ